MEPQIVSVEEIAAVVREAGAFSGAGWEDSGSSALSSREVVLHLESLPEDPAPIALASEDLNNANGNAIRLVNNSERVQRKEQDGTFGEISSAVTLTGHSTQ